MGVAKASLDVVVKRKFTFFVRTRHQYLQSKITSVAELSHRFHFFFIIFTFVFRRCFSSADFVALDEKETASTSSEICGRKR